MKNQLVKLFFLYLCLYMNNSLVFGCPNQNLYRACDELLDNIRKTMMEKQCDLNSDQLKKWLNEDYIDHFFINIEKETDNKKDRDLSCTNVVFDSNDDLTENLLQKYQLKEYQLACLDISFVAVNYEKWRLSLSFQALSDGELWGDIETIYFIMDVDFKSNTHFNKMF